MTIIAFQVIGTPRPQGSKRAVPLRGRGGWVTTPNGATKTILMESSKQLKPWRDDVRSALLASHKGPPLEGPVHVSIAFRFRRPDSHYGKRKGERYLKETSPKWHTNLGDIEKLVRAIHDAMSGIAFHDDKQVAAIIATKEWADVADATIIVKQLQERNHDTKNTTQT